ncbi:leucine-rich repeat neuronal protein 4 [Notolabrus celidotus]|uniref:leucine-rich repeat neuronal protein 4 n=1 Tax=Notolabrus celidotus TaxID=1203425 RepID=UPI00148F6E29|nr:leucine-rich repeat neuronal protein 4 [Notolabrus celidotus]
MASCRDRPFLQVIICLLLIRGSSPLPTTSDENPTGPLRPRGFSDEDLTSEDYNVFELTTSEPRKSLLPVTVKPTKCNYNPCLESQIPCANLSVSTGCLCRGATLHNEAPEAPDLKSVSWNGSEVVIQWCAPYSYVTLYAVTVGGKERQKFGKDQRGGALGDIENVAKVCVVAVNDAGSSEESCMMFQPRDSSLPLKAGLIGGALGFLLLLLLAVLLWRHRRQRKQEASISLHNTAETH